MTPKLRFKEFSEEWESKKLADVAKLTSSKRVHLADYVQEGIPFFRGKEITELKDGKQPQDLLYISHNQFNEIKKKYGVPKNNEILITAVGTLGNAYLINLNYQFYFKDGNLIWFKEITENPHFMIFLFDKEKRKILSSSIGSTQRALTIQNLNTLVFNFPTLAEQNKIANFLTLVDTKINQLQQKYDLLTQYKKGVMQQIFSQKLRFKKDDGTDFADWDYKSLKDVLGYHQPTKFIVSSTEYDNSFLTPVLTAGKSFILGYTNEKTGIFEGAKNNVIIFDDFTTSSHFVDFNFKVKSSAIKILYKINELDNIRYLYSAFSTLVFRKGNEHKRRWISEYSLLDIPYPSIEEQTKIANFLTAIDDKITNTEQQLKQTQQWKKGLLQQMFV